MYRVIVKTTSDVTANLEADKITEEGEFIRVFNDSELVGVFDIGSVLFIYKTKAKAKEKNDETV